MSDWIRGNEDLNFLKSTDEDPHVFLYMVNARSKDDSNKTDRDKDVCYGTLRHSDDIDTILRQFKDMNNIRLYVHINGSSLKKFHYENGIKSLKYLAELNSVKLDPFSFIGSNLTENSPFQKFFLLDIDLNESTKDITKDQIISYINNISESLKYAQIEIIDFYKTKNGFHCITRPFNFNDFKSKFDIIYKNIDISMQKNGFSLIAYK